MGPSIYPVFDPLVKGIQQIAIWTISFYALATVVLILKCISDQLKRIPFYIAEYIACKISDFFRFGESARDCKKHHKQIKKISSAIQEAKSLSDSYNNLQKR